ncbi:putative coiled-coil domain-containing protein-like [Heracleum sosnowskyi]|uniref:Coiled-coil domain-containing protein-like n=1 Tax=Heracleum sosnowskyi TaxID=360622 RepID=A0AAD8ICU8_9APIA|nr:putative coiled-coil domain-containing protein-like [Heracleum sosnowskyi]
MDKKVEEAGKKNKATAYESLGWLTESTVMPKKHKPISGIGASSIFELKAQLYKAQEESKNLGRESNLPSSCFEHVDVYRAKKKIVAHDPFAAKNHGVESRNHKDKLELKALNEGAVSYAALEKKAELYDKLARGELSDEEDTEKYCVDFSSKIVQDEPQHPQGHEASGTGQTEYGDGDDGSSVLPNTKPMGLGRAGATFDNEEHKRFVKEVHEEVNQAREKVSEAKLRREEQATLKREKLKQAFLRKKLEKLQASNTAK